jgi:predicted MFS family arabinose efflux permease
VVDTGTRSVYPFIDDFATGLGLTLTGFSWLIFMRASAGVLGPPLGLLADRIGRRALMSAGLLAQAAGVVGVMLLPGWWAAIPMFVFGLTLPAFIPAEQAYLSDRVAYQKRGRALATVELSWALSAIISLPIIGWLIDAFGWRAPLAVLGLFSLLGAATVWVVLPGTEHKAETQLTWTDIWRVGLRPNVAAAIGVGFLLFVGVASFGTVWGIWLKFSFGLGAAVLGLVGTTIGVAELAGSGFSSLFIDRIGKRRGSMLGLVFSAVVFAALPLTQSALPLAIGGLFLLGIGVEFTVVSLIPLYSEQAPDARATVFALVGLGVAVSVAISAPITVALWESSGLWGVSAIGAGSLLLALGLVWLMLHER